MKIDPRSERDLSDANVKKETGKSRKEWFAAIDAFGGIAKGRREIGGHLVNDLKLDPWWSATLNVEYEASKKAVEKDGKPKGFMICATKSVKAGPDACYALFATAKNLDAWLGSGSKLKLAAGGTLETADGDNADVVAVTPGKRIRLRWKHASVAPDTPVEITFQGASGKTTVMIAHDRIQTRAEADGLRAAWGQALERLKATAEG